VETPIKTALGGSQYILIGGAILALFLITRD
jgi:hypothetical protein